MTRRNIYPDGNGNQVIEELDANGNVINTRVVPDGPIHVGNGVRIGDTVVVGDED